MDSETDISLCMIVRDEAEALAACLEAARGLVRQIVVVDTGSVDGTVELAADLGAEVHDFEWRDDFAAARNESLRHARCPWILVLDADELVKPESAAGIGILLADGSISGLKVTIDNLNADGPDQAFTMVRLFRNDPAIWFENRIHENVLASLARLERKRGLRVAECGLRIEHHGYLPGRLRRKGERNLGLIRAELELRPDDLFLRMKEYEELEKLGRREECGGRIDEAYAIVRRLGPGEIRGLPFAPLLIANFALEAIGRGLHEAGLAAAAWGLRVFPGEPWLLYADALGHLRQAKVREAIEKFSACLGLEIRPADYYIEPGIASWLSHYHLGEAYLLAADAARAKVHLERCLAAKPDFTDAERLIVEAILRLSDAQAAMKLIIEMLRRDPGDLWALVNGANILLTLGLLDRAEQWLGRALKLRPDLGEAKALMGSIEEKRRNG